MYFRILKMIATSSYFSQLKSAPNSFSAGAPPRTPLGSLQRPRPSSWFKGALLLRGSGREEREMRGERGANSWIRPWSL